MTMESPPVQYKSGSLTIRGALALAFGTVLGLMFVICAAAWLFLDELDQDLELIATDVMPRLVVARNLVLANDSLASVAGRMVQAADADELKRHAEFFQQASQQLQQDLLAVEGRLMEPGQFHFLQQVHRQIDQKLRLLSEQVGLILTGRTAATTLKSDLLATNRAAHNALSLTLQQGLPGSAEKHVFAALEILHELERLIYQLTEASSQQQLDELAVRYENLVSQLNRSLGQFASLPVARELDPYLRQLPLVAAAENSLLSRQRSLLDNQARISSLANSCVQLTAQFRLLTTVVVKDSTAQMENVRAEAETDIEQRKMFMGGMLLVSLVFTAVVISYIGHRRMVRPLRDLSQAMATLGQGELPQTARQQGVWEVQALAESFRQMAETIARRDHDLHQLQLLLRNVIDSLASQLIAVDQHCRTTLWNLPAERYGAMALAEGAQLKEILSWLPVDFSLIEQSVQDRQPLHLKRLSLLWDGQQRSFELSCTPLHDEFQPGAVVRIEDVTERLRLDKTIAQSEKMMSIGGLAAGIAHEINNPLAGIMQSTQVLENRLDPDFLRNAEVAVNCGTDMESIGRYLDQRGIKGLLRGIRSSADQGAKIVKNMLAFSRSGSVIEEPCFEMTDLAGLIDNTLSLLRSDFELRQGYDFRRIRIERSIAESLPLVSCERSLIQQVIFNILKNSAQAFASAPVDITAPWIKIGLVPDGAQLKLTVEDNGPGMSTAVRQRIFEPFYTTKEPGIGTGLGMSVAYFIITDYHHGRIAVESEPGAGSRFIIHLPVEKNPQDISP